MSLSVIILTMNESKNITECINSVKQIANRIIVVDSGSTDDTIAKAQSVGAEVHYNKFIDYSSQFNWAIDNLMITTKWTMRLDADERITPDLANEIDNEMKKNNETDINGMVLKLKIYFLGKWLKHGDTYPFRKLMVFKTGIGRIEKRKMDEHTILSSGTSIELKNDGLHYDFKNLNYWINKQNWYATREMQDYFENKNSKSIRNLPSSSIKSRRKQKTVYYKLPKFHRAFFLFIYRYIFKLGFLDGKQGLIFQFLQTYWYRFLVDSKIYEHEKMGLDFEETGALVSK